MADKGPILTSGIIFYISIGAAIFQILEEPHWKIAVTEYSREKAKLLQQYPCLSKHDLDKIVEVVAQAAGQGVTITGQDRFENWNWQNAAIFAATIITTIGFGNVAPKTTGGRVFCIFYGLCGIPLCLTWISELGSFFGNRAKRLSGVLLHKGLSVGKVQLICTAVFLLWGLLVHLVIPPLIFTAVEDWSYLEGLYFSFITLTTVGFGDYVAGVNPSMKYPILYRFFVQIWMFMGLAWLSLFFSWNVHMVVKAHKVLKKRRKRHYKSQMDTYWQSADENQPPRLTQAASCIDIFNFMSEKSEDYGDVIHQIGADKTLKIKQEEDITRSKSCSDILGNMVVKLEQSPRQKRRQFSVSDHINIVITKAKESLGSFSKEQEEERLLTKHSGGTEEPSTADQNVLDEATMARPGHSSWDLEEPYPQVFESQNTPVNSEEKTESVAGTRFIVYQVPEKDLLDKETG